MRAIVDTVGILVGLTGTVVFAYAFGYGVGMQAEVETLAIAAMAGSVSFAFSAFLAYPYLKAIKFRHTRQGGIHFFRVNKLHLAFCWCKKSI